MPERTPRVEQLTEALAAHAKGSVDVIVNLASACDVGWDEALRAYPDAYKAAAKAVLERATAARDRRAAEKGGR